MQRGTDWCQIARWRVKVPIRCEIGKCSQLARIRWQKLTRKGHLQWKQVDQKISSKSAMKERSEMINLSTSQHALYVCVCVCECVHSVLSAIQIPRWGRSTGQRHGIWVAAEDAAEIRDRKEKEKDRHTQTMHLATCLLCLWSVILVLGKV